MVTFPAIELYRAELNAMSYTPLSDPKLAVLRQRYADAHHSCAIEDIHPDAEQLAFTTLMVELRVPPGPRQSLQRPLPTGADCWASAYTAEGCRGRQTPGIIHRQRPTRTMPSASMRTV